MDKRSDTPENASKTAAKLAERDPGPEPVGRPAGAIGGANGTSPINEKAAANDQPVLKLGFVSEIADSE